jgi:hypothetical protein
VALISPKDAGALDAGLRMDSAVGHIQAVVTALLGVETAAGPWCPFVSERTTELFSLALKRLDMCTALRRRTGGVEALPPAAQRDLVHVVADAVLTALSACAGGAAGPLGDVQGVWPGVVARVNTSLGVRAPLSTTVCSSCQRVVDVMAAVLTAQPPKSKMAKTDGLKMSGVCPSSSA